MQTLFVKNTFVDFCELDAIEMPASSMCRSRSCDSYMRVDGHAGTARQSLELLPLVSQRCQSFDHAERLSAAVVSKAMGTARPCMATRGTPSWADIVKSGNDKAEDANFLMNGSRSGAETETTCTTSSHASGRGQSEKSSDSDEESGAIVDSSEPATALESNAASQEELLRNIMSNSYVFEQLRHQMRGCAPGEAPTSIGSLIEFCQRLVNEQSA